MDYLLLGALMLGGVVIGIFVGSIPGLTATMAISLLVPFSFYLDTVQSFAFLLAVYDGAICGGSISSILIGIPGTPAATATRLDGYPMSRKGEAGKAIGISIVSSVIGTYVSLIILVLVARKIAEFSLYFGSPEYFALAVLGLTICVSVSTRSLIKGLISALLGLFLAVVGLDPVTGFDRYTFGFLELYEGIPYIPAMIGLFGFAEVLSQLERKTFSFEKFQRLSFEKFQRLKKVIPRFKEIKPLLPSMVRSGFIGSIVGAIPGAGGNIAAFLSYDVTKRISKKETIPFGQGNPKGIASSESGNNGVTGGALIPMLTFGIPGDSVTAILLGALLIQGIEPGAALFTKHAATIYTIFLCLGIANTLELFAGLTLAKYFARLATIKEYMLNPVIAVLCMVGAFSMRNAVFDVVLMMIFGVIGWLMKKAKIPEIPLILGLILGFMAEDNLRRTLKLSDGSLQILLERPLALTLLILSVIFLVLPLTAKIKSMIRGTRI
jgi:putative tricarboxylic transport membrane protein